MTIHIGSRREVLWDDYLIDTEQSTVTRVMQHPIRRERVLDYDMPWEGDGCDFQNIVKVGDIWRMYYLAWRMMNEDMTMHTQGEIYVCCIDSRDGFHWERPVVGACEFNGSKENNILLDKSFCGGFDNFYVFKDQNPSCPPEELYKATYAVWITNPDSSVTRLLECACSADGLHFVKKGLITDKGKFDSLNICHYNPHTGKYILFLRDFHEFPEGIDEKDGKIADLNEGIRDVRMIESADFKYWSEPVMLDFNGADDYPLYTSVAQPYYRADHVMVGFPSRYVERRAWSSNFERLCGAEMRKKRIEIHPRYGYTTTDCLFMCTRDGKTWDRPDEAFMRPGKENEWTWVYGDCYPSLGMIESPTDIPGEDPDLSMYIPMRHWSTKSSWLYRYTLRVDGFVSRHATYKPQLLVTKPFRFSGGSLSINFETSAMGYMVIELTDKNGRPLEGYTSCELFGDSISRIVDFPGDLSKLAGRTVRIRITMSDADIYSFKFE
jgi:hypothetical protein